MTLYYVMRVVTPSVVTIKQDHLKYNKGSFCQYEKVLSPSIYKILYTVIYGLLTGIDRAKGEQGKYD